MIPSFETIIKTEFTVNTYDKHIVKGFCHICQEERRLYIDPTKRGWGNTYTCFMCGTNCRIRAFMMVMDFYFPSYKKSYVHESGAGGWFNHISDKTPFYTSSTWNPDVEAGIVVGKSSGDKIVYNQNLEHLTFKDNTFDYFITQDVFEHINYPEKAAKEIMRVLKPGGKHVFTIPARYTHTASEPRIKIEDNEIIHIKPPEYHHYNNDENSPGWLVTYDYGNDFLDLMASWTNNHTNVYIVQEMPGVVQPDRVIEVFVTTKAKI